METQPTPVTFESLKAANFQSLTPDLRRDMEYMEQLALQTGTNISDWPVFEMLSSVSAGDRRAINKVFFARADASSDDAIEKSLALIQANEDVLKQIDEANNARLISDARYNRDYYLQQAREFYRNYEARLKSAAEQNDKLRLMEQTPSVSFYDNLQVIVKKGFFEFLSYSSSKVSLVTRANIVMTEKNPALGIDRRVDFGRFRFVINASDRTIIAHPHQNNLIYDGIMHPYMTSGGNICWGNASGTVDNLRLASEWPKVMDLLAALLTTYSPDSTPYLRLHDFERYSARGKAGGDICSTCEEPVDDCSCERCSTCEALQDDCTCSYCEACDVTYPESDSCGGYYCEICEECNGGRRCDDHWCGICATYNDNDCECCQDCDRVQDECECQEEEEEQPSGQNTATNPEEITF